MQAIKLKLRAWFLIALVGLWGAFNLLESVFLSHSSSNPGRSTGQAWTPATIENGPNDDTWVLIKPSDADTGSLLVRLGQYHSSYGMNPCHQGIDSHDFGYVY